LGPKQQNLEKPILNLSTPLGSETTLGWTVSYLTDFLPEPVYCHPEVPQGSHLGPFFFTDDVDEVLRIFEHVSAMGIADYLKLYMTINNVKDCRGFQSDLDRLQEWCIRNKFDLNAKKMQKKSLSRGARIRSSLITVLEVIS
jgi:hypothetical protein